MQTNKTGDSRAQDVRFEKLLRQAATATYSEKPHQFSNRHWRQMHRLFHGNRAFSIEVPGCMALCAAIVILAVWSSRHGKSGNIMLKLF